MSTLKCKMCGGALLYEEGKSVVECEYCSSLNTIPNIGDEKRLQLFERANRLRSNCDFEKASGVYELIVSEYPEEAEAYWGLVLCKYGIEYVDDPATKKKIPTCHRSSFESVFDDSNFEMVMEYSDSSSRAVYRDEAKQIEEIRKGIVQISSKEEPYDIFICYKETDDEGNRTVDSTIAQDVYDALIQKEYKVFFSRITLEDKLGQEYEPYIFAALNSAKIMLAFGTSYDNYNAVWVKNEWTRYLKLVESDKSKYLIPCYKGIDAYDMPKEFSKLQAQDMGKVGAIQDLLRGIEKILPKKKAEQKEIVINSNSTAVTALLDRGQMAIEDGDWDAADKFFEEVLNQNAKCPEAYLGKFLVSNKAVSLMDLQKKIEEKYAHADPEILQARESDGEHISGIVEKYYIPDYLEKNNIEKLYEYDLGYPSVLKSRETQKNETLNSLESDRTFTRMNQYASGESKSKVDSLVAGLTATFDSRIEEAKKQDAESAERVCLEYATFLENADSKVEEEYKKACEKKEADYNQTVSVGRNAATSDGCEKAINDIKKNYSGFKDSEDVLTELTAKAKVLKEKEEIAARKKKNKTRNTTIAVVSALIVVTAVILTFTVFIPNSKYNSAVVLMDNGQYDEAITAFQALDGYKDSDDKIDECNLLIVEGKYNAAIELFNNGQYEDAITGFTDIYGYGDSSDYILNSKYQIAMDLKNNGQYEEAITAFSELNSFSDCENQIEECNALLEMQSIYDNAVSLFNDGQYEEALYAFQEVGSFSDAAQQVQNCEELLYIEAKALLGNEQYDEAIEKLEVIEDYNDAEELVRNAYFEKLVTEDHSVGDTVVFGNYTNNANVDYKGWIILDISGTQMLLFCTTPVVHSIFDSYSNVWNTSEIKNWLNNTYLEEAFNDQEQSLIVDKGYGEVFLLSVDEYNSYSDVINNGVGFDCWLRSPGNNSNLAASVRSDGRVIVYGDYVDDSSGVRPAIWIDLSLATDD